MILSARERKQCESKVEYAQNSEYALAHISISPTKPRSYQNNKTTQLSCKRTLDRKKLIQAEFKWISASNTSKMDIDLAEAIDESMQQVRNVKVVIEFLFW